MENIRESNGNSFLLFLKTFLSAGFVAGTLDILAAIIVYQFIYGVTTAGRILQLIASGVFGKPSFERGTETMIYGLIFHYLIAFGWAFLFALLFPRLALLRNYRVIGGLIYGAIVWLLMNLIILPLSNVAGQSFKWDSVLVGMIILMICIGLPISLITGKFYNRRI